VEFLMNQWTTRVAFVLFSMTASSVFGQTFDRGWIDINVASVTSAQDEQQYVWQGRIFNEIATFSAAYPALPRATGLLSGAGVRVLGGLGVGVQWIQAKYEYDVGLAANIPHPVLFNRFGSDATLTNERLTRKDNAVDISAVFQVPTRDHWRVRVFGGPTFFKLNQEFVQDIAFSQVFNLLGTNIIDITNYSSQTVDESTWGFHAGADVGFFFSRHVGVGGGARFNRGTVSLSSEPLSEQPADIKVGGAVVDGGLRLRF
jgi:hypothetical protein